MPTNGVGNICADPQLASASHLSAESPCIGAGSATYASGTDIDGEAWANPPSIGCDEYRAGAVTGPLTVSLTATFTNVAMGFPVELTAVIAGRTDLSAWEFGDGFLQVNEPYTSHTWTVPGIYQVALWVFNDSHPEGVSATVRVQVLDHPVQYVALNSVNPVAPYLSWATAATNIQDALDAVVPGAMQVLVTNGTYVTGGRWIPPYGDTYRVRVDRRLTVQSVNGPNVTVINGGGAADCVYLSNDAVLAGFTLTNGYRGAYCESMSNVLSNCVVAGNSFGGVYGGTLNNCTLNGNSSGGARSATLNNCVVSGNTGGGAYASTLNNCTVTGNDWGVGTATLNNCIVYFNSDPNGGNYDQSSTLNYCCTTPMPANGVGNISVDPQLASASHLSAESPCIGAGSATYASGTDIDGEAWANPPSVGCDEYRAGAVTGPLTVGLTATLTNVVISYNAGLTAFIEGRTDLSVWDFGDGFVQVNEPYTSHTWTTPGDYLVALWVFNDSYPGGVSATLTIHVEEGLHYVAASSGNPVAPYTSWTTAATNIQDAVDVAPPGATIFVTNGTYAAGGRTTPLPWDGATNRVAVDKPLTVRSINGPEVTVIQGQMPGATNGYIRCVYLTDGAVLVGFTLTNGVAGIGGGVYCESTSAMLSNCVVTGNVGSGAYGGTLYNCVLTRNSALSAGGGAYGCTLNDCTLTANSVTGYNSGGGGGAYRCELNNCTLTANSAAGLYNGGGGGAFGCTLNNCTLASNSATGADSTGGGGAYACELNNCTLTANSVTGTYSAGGGVWDSTLNNCTLTGNQAQAYGGGAYYYSRLNNCILYYNIAPSEPNYVDLDSTLNNCCTTPMPTIGVGNITNAPLFVDQAHGNLRLQANSPCINSGNNTYAPGPTDLDGNLRIVGGTVDFGAYEFQSPASCISYAWLQQYGLPMDGSADFTDPDHDGLNNWQEWRCGTCPTNADSALRLLAPQRTGTNVTVTWQSVAGVNYFLECSTNLSATPCFTCVATNLPGQPGTTSYTDTHAAAVSPLFYRVGVKSP